MIKAINAGDKNELRKLLKMYSQPVYQRALAATGTPERAKEVTKLVLTYVNNCANAGTCRENVDAWLMAVTDSHAERYMESLRAEEAAKNSYFTAPTVAGSAPTTDAYSAQKPIYESSSAPKEEEVGNFIPFSPTLEIPERPEFSDRHSDCSTQSRISSITPPSAPNVTASAAPFTPPQYVPPQYTPPQESRIMDEIKASESSRTAYAGVEKTVSAAPVSAAPVSAAPSADFTRVPTQPSFTAPSEPVPASDNIVPISLNDDDEFAKKVKPKQKKKKRSFLNNGVIIAVLTIILLLVVGVLVYEIASILISA